MNKDSLVGCFGTEDECRTFLEKGYMSDEEPFEKNAQGQVVSYHRLVPGWRSDKVSFVKELSNNIIIFFFSYYVFLLLASSVLHRTRYVETSREKRSWTSRTCT